MVKQGGSTINTIDSANRFIKDIDPQMKWDYASSAPFLVFLGMTRKTSGFCRSEKPAWLKRDGVPRQVISAAATDVAATIGFKDGSFQAIRATDIIENDRTREQVFVTATPTGTGTVSVSVTRGYAGTTAAAVLDDDVWTRIGNAQGYWSEMPDLIATDPEDDFNYIQLFRHPFGADKRLIQVAESGGMIGLGELDYLDGETYRDHVESVERALLRGVPSKVGEVTTMGGLDYFITRSGTAANNYDFTSAGVLTEKLFTDYLYDMKKYAVGKRTICICGTELPAAIDEWAKDKLRIQPKAKEYGLNIQTYNSRFGDVDLIIHPFFGMWGWDDRAYFLDEESARLLGLKGRRDTVLNTGPSGKGLQANDVDGKIFEYRCEPTLKMEYIERCGLAQGIQAVAG